VPRIADENLSYGFAVSLNQGDCCKCFQLTWTSGNAKGKQMVVQVLNLAKPDGDVGKNDLVILTPGGGSGPNESGCRNQYGTTW